MKLKTFTLLLAFNCFIACNEQPTRQETNVKDSTPIERTEIPKTPIPLDGCYRMVSGQDTAIMRINLVDSVVTGELSYRLLAKDRNDGTIKGVLRDSIIIANYTFRSEGMISVRQVAFRLNGINLVEGFGDLDTSGDTVRFKDVRSLTFQHDRPFNKVPCIE